MADDNTVLNARQAATLLGAHMETIRRMARRGEIPAYKIGKGRRFRRSALMVWPQALPDQGRTAGIMMIDDEAGARRRIRRYLEDRGHRVTAVADPRDGLDRIRRDGADMVLPGLNMPDVKNGRWQRS